MRGGRERRAATWPGSRAFLPPVLREERLASRRRHEKRARDAARRRLTAHVDRAIAQGPGSPTLRKCPRKSPSGAAHW
ncbi:hypothetical protein MRX96_054473 [Rhipicephalus microplus]